MTTAGNLGLAPSNCICDPMDLAALGHMTNCPAYVEPEKKQHIVLVAGHGEIAAGVLAHLAAEAHLRGVNLEVVDPIDVRPDPRRPLYGGELQARLVQLPPDGRMGGGTITPGLLPRHLNVTPPPDRLSVDPDSEYFNREVASRVRVWFKGDERSNVVEYCVSKGWVKLQARDGRRRPLWRKGKHVTLHLQGPVEVKWKD